MWVGAGGVSGKADWSLYKTVPEAEVSWGEGGGGTHRGLGRREKQTFGISRTPTAGFGG